MKLKKTIGNLLTGLGCIIVLIGILAYSLPKVQNRQFQLVLSSFQTPSKNGFIQAINNVMNFAMAHWLWMLLPGMLLICLGILLNVSARTDAQAVAARRQPAPRPVAQTAAASTAAATGAAATVRPFQSLEALQEEAPAPQPKRVNPFARYAKDENLPKSTTPPKQEALDQVADAHTDASDSAYDHQDDILSIWDQLQRKPANEDDPLFIQPVHMEDDHAYRRPEESPAPFAVPAVPETALPDEPEEPALPDVPIVPVFNTTPAAEAAPVPAPAAAPAAQPNTSPQRPVIRSTFRKSTAAQPDEAPVENNALLPQTPAADEAALPAEPAAQPASRIKSTMGRKR